MCCIEFRRFSNGWGTCSLNTPGDWTLGLQTPSRTWIIGFCVWFGLIYSFLMSQRHAGHWSSIPVSIPAWNFWQREMTIRPCTHLPRQKVMRLCCWKYHYKASGLHSGLTAPSNSAACQLACLACLLKKKRNKKQSESETETAREAPHADTNEHAGVLSSWEWLAIRNVLKHCFECVPQMKDFHWGVVVRCFSLGSASDLVSNCGIADKAAVAGSFLSGAFCYALVPFLSDPTPKAPGNKKTHRILFLHPSAYCFVLEFRLNLTH